MNPSAAAREGVGKLMKIGIDLGRKRPDLETAFGVSRGDPSSVEFCTARLTMSAARPDACRFLRLAAAQAALGSTPSDRVTTVRWEARAHPEVRQRTEDPTIRKFAAKSASRDRDRAERPIRCAAYQSIAVARPPNAFRRLKPKTQVSSPPVATTTPAPAHPWKSCRRALHRGGLN